MIDKVPSSYSSVRAAQLNLAVMRNRASQYSLFLLAAIALHAEAAKPPYSLESIALISPMPIVEERTGDAKSLSPYINNLKAIVFATLSSRTDLPNASFSVIAAVKPGSLSRVWIEAGPPGLGNELAEALKVACMSVKAFDVSGGPIALSLNFKLGRGGKSPNFPGSPFPLPKEWQDALEKSGGRRIPDDALSVIWP